MRREGIDSMSAGAIGRCRTMACTFGRTRGPIATAGTLRATRVATAWTGRQSVFAHGAIVATNLTVWIGGRAGISPSNLRTRPLTASRDGRGATVKEGWATGSTSILVCGAIGLLATTVGRRRRRSSWRRAGTPRVRGSRTIKEIRTARGSAGHSTGPFLRAIRSTWRSHAHAQ